MTTYTFTRALDSKEAEEPFNETVGALSRLPQGWLGRLPGKVTSAMHAAVLPPLGTEGALFVVVQRDNLGYD